MKPIRLLLVTDAVGGVWNYSVELARALRPLGVETVLAVMGPSPSSNQREEANGLRLIDTGLPLEWLDTDPREICKAGKTIAAIAASEQADLVQTCSAALLAQTDFDCPTIAAQHSCVASWWAAVKVAPLPLGFEWRRELVEEGLKRASAIVAPSLTFAAETAGIYGVQPLAVHNGREQASSRDIPQGDFMFTAGRLWDEGKNVATLDAAAAHTGVPFQAAGSNSGPDGTHVQLRHAKVLGHLSQLRLAGLFSARPIYASAALYEPFGLSVLEAASAGCALVLSDIPTHREIWGSAAIFAPPSDEHAFAAAVQDLIDDPDERQQLGQLARARAAHYTAGRMARAMADIYAVATTAGAEQMTMAGAA